MLNLSYWHEFHRQTISRLWAGAKRIKVNRAMVTKESKGFRKFKTSTLLNITLYIRDSGLAGLEDVITFYNHGGRPNLYKEMKPLQLTDTEKADLLEFLKSFTGY